MFTTPILVLGTALFVAYVLNWSHVVVSQRSPDGKWTISAEFDGFDGVIILRDAVGNEVARGERVGLDSEDFKPNLNITNDTASDDNFQTSWRLDAATGAWHRIPLGMPRSLPNN